jgi:hypothetical protein
VRDRNSDIRSPSRVGQQCLNVNDPAQTGLLSRVLVDLHTIHPPPYRALSGCAETCRPNDRLMPSGR